MWRNKSIIRIASLSLLISIGCACIMSCDLPTTPKETHQTSALTPHLVNKDSIALAELRDSLRKAAPAPAAASSNLGAFATLMKMNVLYIGVDNPIAINTFGFPTSDLMIDMTGGTVTQSGSAGIYVVRVTSGPEATLNISAKVNGTLVPISSARYRVKRIPDPAVYVQSIKGDGQMTKTEVGNIRGVFAKSENFDFDVTWEIASFVMSKEVNGVYVDYRSDGPALTEEMKKLLAGAKTGDKILFEQVVVKGVDGTLRKVPGVEVRVK